MLQGIDAQFSAQVFGSFGFGILQCNAGPVGDFYDRIERCDGGAGIDERCVSKGIAYRVLCRRQSRGVITQNRVDKFEQRAAVRHAAGIGRAVENRRQRVVIAACLAALTEQRRMAGGSIIAPVDGRGAGGDQLDLGMRDRAVFL